jgi:hypothetical protein
MVEFSKIKMGKPKNKAGRKLQVVAQEATDLDTFTA